MTTYETIQQFLLEHKDDSLPTLDGNELTYGELSGILERVIDDIGGAK